MRNDACCARTNDHGMLSPAHRELGQGDVSVTPLQVLWSAALVAWRGVRYQPRLLFGHAAGSTVVRDKALGHYTHEKNPVACAAGLATIEVIEKEGLLENARLSGGYALQQMRGWMAEIHRQRDFHRQVIFYARLADLVEFFRRWTVIAFDSLAADQLLHLKRARIRIGTMDLKIAAIALANDATLLTRNLSDFRKVPQLRAEDWTL